MEEKYRWLFHEPQSLKEIVKTCCRFFWLDFCCALFVSLPLLALARAMGRVSSGKLDQLLPENEPLAYTIIIILIVIVIEEILFRLLPLAAGVVIANISGKNWPILTAMIGSSLVFGFAHGGALFIPIQGVAGFIYCMLFFRVGGRTNLLRATLATTAVHTAFNAVILTPIILLR